MVQPIGVAAREMFQVLRDQEEVHKGTTVSPWTAQQGWTMMRNSGKSYKSFVISRGVLACCAGLDLI